MGQSEASPGWLGWADRNGTVNNNLFHSGRILVVDDEPLVLEVTRVILEEHGYEVITAESGSQALGIFLERGGTLDLVLLDMVMPEMSGEETLEAMRAVRSEVLFAMSTGYDTAELAMRLAGKGLAGFIQKPYTFEELTTKIAAILSSGNRSEPSEIMNHDAG